MYAVLESPEIVDLFNSNSLNQQPLSSNRICLSVILSYAVVTIRYTVVICEYTVVSSEYAAVNSEYAVVTGQ